MSLNSQHGRGSFLARRRNLTEAPPAPLEVPALAPQEAEERPSESMGMEDGPLAELTPEDSQEEPEGDDQ